MTLQIKKDGLWQEVTKQQFMEVVQQGIIRPETIIQYNGKAVKAKYIKGLTFPELTDPKIKVQYQSTAENERSQSNTKADDGNQSAELQVDTLGEAKDKVVDAAKAMGGLLKAGYAVAAKKTGSLGKDLSEKVQTGEVKQKTLGLFQKSKKKIVFGGTVFGAIVVLYLASSMFSSRGLISLPPQTAQVVAKVEHAIARIEGPGGSGSGFLIRPGILVTNHHVITDARDRLNISQINNNFKARFPSAPEGKQGPYSVRFFTTDEDRDLAFLRVETDLSPISLAEDHQFTRGQDIIVIGSPGDLENAVNIGVLSSVSEIGGQTYYQLGIAVNPGNSGGPVIDREGNVIGVVTLKSRIQESVAYCVPIADVQRMLTDAINAFKP